jgi:hypothetical protein
MAGHGHCQIEEERWIYGERKRAREEFLAQLDERVDQEGKMCAFHADEQT